MKHLKLIIIFFFALCLAFIPNLLADEVNFDQKAIEGKKELWLENGQIQCSIILEKGILLSEVLSARPRWLERFSTSSLSLALDADFRLKVVWAGWKAPQKINNADNLIWLSKKDFRFDHHLSQKLVDGAIKLDLFFKGVNNPFELQLSYRLEPETFYFRRRIAVRDSGGGLHFLSWFWPRYGYLFGDMAIIKKGGFGQPAAIKTGEGGAFFGLEYPTAENKLKKVAKGKTFLGCAQEIGEKIGSSWIKSEWVVAGLSPEPRLKHWFWKYIDKIRVAPLKPYLLYNSWYDFRSPEIVKDPGRAMTEENVLRTIASFRKKLVEERGLNLDAFVLDDGWDIYRSDWLLSKNQFPKGLSPLVKALQSQGTQLGLWLGPIGGYSHRDWRVGWMKANGYEVVGNQMCVAGKHYHQLLKKRLTDFVSQDNISYYKLDGIQFSCNELDHGHLPDIYSRRAVMEAVIDLCRSLRVEKPDIFLNITSGTWLSPWWLKYANTIWMQGYDYGYANVPSLSRRDRAMTYRDSVLFDDLKGLDFWFPIANLMTHGLIKGRLNPFGGREEPLKKFTDNALLYFARGISMWELYISPDFLTDAQWDILAKAIRWAKDRFPLLRWTEMIGQDPDQRKPYGYAHFSGKHGLVAVRNPFIQPQTLALKLSESIGLDPDANSLVWERVYPNRWISPELYYTGSVINIPLQGYETAIYEIYPLEEAKIPLLAGRIFELKPKGDKEYILTVYQGEKEGKLLNPEKVKTIKFQEKTLTPLELKIPGQPLPKYVEHVSLQGAKEKGQFCLDVSFNLKEKAQKEFLAVLLEPSREALDKKDPTLTFLLDGKETKPKVERQEGYWGWYMVKVKPEKHCLRMLIRPYQKEREWNGLASVWLLYSAKANRVRLSLDMKQKISLQRSRPPHPLPLGEIGRHIKLGSVEVKVKKD